jgi:hypothetical protein
MERMPWFKWWNGTTSDPKFRMIAEECTLSVAVVIGIWAYVLEQASKSEERGSFADLDKRLMAYTLKLEVFDVETVCNAMKRAGIVTENMEVQKWDERQGKREKGEAPGASTKRVQALRERQRAAAEAGSSDSSSGNGDVTDVTAGNGLERTKKEKKKERNIKPKPISSSSDDAGPVKPFDRFWNAYPRRVGKQAAQKAWAKIKPDAALVDQMLAAIVAQQAGADWRREGGEFIPHPASWLNGGRWLDEVREYVAPAPKVGAWWATREAMTAFALTLSPPLKPLSGEFPHDFKARINAALENAGKPVQVAPGPTPYVPPIPARDVGGESALSADQQAARRAELLKTVGSRRTIDQPE